MQQSFTCQLNRLVATFYLQKKNNLIFDCPKANEMNKLIYISIVLLAGASYLTASEEKPAVQADQPPVDLNQGIEIQIESHDEPKKRPLTRLITSAIRGVEGLVRNLTKEAATYAGAVSKGTYNFVKNTASTGFNAIRRSANRIAHPRGGPLYDAASNSPGQSNKVSNDLKKAAAEPNELTNNQVVASE